MLAPLDQLVSALAKTGMTRFFRRLFDDYPDLLMKDQTIEEVLPRSCDQARRAVGHQLRLG